MIHSNVTVGIRYRAIVKKRLRATIKIFMCVFLSQSVNDEQNKFIVNFHQPKAGKYVRFW